MGAATSSVSRLEENELLIRLVGIEQIADTHEFWNNLLGFRIIIPRDSPQSSQVEHSIQGLCASLVANGHTTHNSDTLVAILTKAANRLAATHESTEQSERLCRQLYNGLLILRLYIKFCVGAFHGDTFQQALEDMRWNGSDIRDRSNEMPPGEDEDVSSALNEPVSDISIGVEGAVLVLAYKLACLATEILTTNLISDTTYWVHSECISVMITLLSSQIYASPSPPPPFAVAMFRACAPKAIEIMTVLLRYNVDRRPPPNGATMLAMLSNLTVNFTKSSNFNISTIFNTPLTPLELPVGSTSMSDDSHVLFLILSSTHMPDKDPTVFKKAIAFIADDETHNMADYTKVELRRTSSSIYDTQSIKGVSFAKIYEYLCSHMHQEGSGVFLYTMLYRSPTFSGFVLSRTDLDSLLLPILEELYKFSDDLHNLSLLLICVLLLSQDASFNTFIHELTLTDLWWFTEKTLDHITLGSLVVLVLIRVAQKNMIKNRDVYIHMSCLASLANMSIGFHGLHPYAAQRIVRLFDLLSRKFAKLDGFKVLKDVGNGLGDDQTPDALICADSIRMILETLDNCLTTNGQTNPHLIYTLMHKRELLLPYKKHVLFSELVHNIEQVINFFQKKLSGYSNEQLSYQLVFGVIEAASKNLPADTIKKLPILMFRYEELADPFPFFLPYVWQVAFNKAPHSYTSRGVALFKIKRQGHTS